MCFMIFHTYTGRLGQDVTILRLLHERKIVSPIRGDTLYTHYPYIHNIARTVLHVTFFCEHFLIRYTRR